jgi:hypothetical protein
MFTQTFGQEVEHLAHRLLAGGQFLQGKLILAVQLAAMLVGGGLFGQLLLGPIQFLESAEIVHQVVQPA